MHIMIGCWCLLMITIASLMMIEGGGGGTINIARIADAGTAKNSISYG